MGMRQEVATKAFIFVLSSELSLICLRLSDFDARALQKGGDHLLDHLLV
jgi:hypothetical protein